MGTPDFSVPTLEALLNSQHEVCAVYTQPPKPAGRGRQSQKTAVHKYAEKRGITVHTPSTLRSQTKHNDFLGLGGDIAVVVAYGLILPPEILNFPRLGCINIHASLLPRWRGAAPIQRAIMAGDKQTGVTIMQMEQGLDTGPILASRGVPISGETTGESLHHSLAHLGAGMIVETINALDKGGIQSLPQPTNGVSYAQKLSREDGHLDWTRPADELELQIRALYPWPGAWSEIANQRIKVFEANVVDTNSQLAKPGTTVDENLTIACGRGCLQLKRIQKSGKRVMKASEYVKGSPVPKGTILC